MMRPVARTLGTVIDYGRRRLRIPDRGTRILCYHRVSDREETYTAVSPVQFRSQMVYLKERGCETTSLLDLLNRQERKNLGLRPVQKRIVITFDDGWRDNYEQAYPTMKSLGFKGIVFLIAEKIGAEGYLTKEHIREMAESGFEFGSHTFSHRDLPPLSLEEKWHEIYGSKLFLSERLGLDIDFFCYPRGLYDQETLELVRKANYRGACSNIPGSNVVPNGNQVTRFNPSLLKRTEIARHDTPDDFKHKLQGAYDVLHQALHLARGKP